MASEDHRYFRVLEEAFLRLRGAPLVLSPADWKLAREWKELGIPSSFVVEVFEEVFERLALREAQAEAAPSEAARQQASRHRRVNGLRYCAPAVEKAWREQAELLGAVVPEASPADPSAAAEMASRLESLAARLPPDWPGSRELAARILALKGDLNDVESALGGIDEAMLEQALVDLESSRREEIESEAQRRSAELGGGEAIVAKIRTRLIREALGLPRLSLVSLRG